MSRFLLLAEKGSSGGTLKDFTNTLASSGRTFNILSRMNLLSNSQSLGNGCQDTITLDQRLSLTSSVVTGRCEVFLSSSITRGSRLRSFLHPTRMMGRPAQKCMTSLIHCDDGIIWVSQPFLLPKRNLYLLLDIVQRIR